MKAYFIRHGQTNYNILDLCNDDPTKDAHLTELGKQQAEIVSEKFKGIKLDAVIISELPRTKETAVIITKNQQVKFIVEPRINDRKTGFEGKPVSDFFEALKLDIFNLKFNSGESFQEEKKRVFSFLKELKNYKFNNILVITHSEILQIINGYFNNLSDREMWNTKIDNCQILEIDIEN
jgi:broad specificity phosphatase PhoE